MTTTDLLSQKLASPDRAVHDWIRVRWSPYAFSPREVSSQDLLALFEAARWAPSSYNEQPWRYIIATRDQSEQFDTVISCLAEGNRPWARRAPVVGIGMTRVVFERNGEPNRAAVHDLGLASAFLTLEATSRGLYVHQMIGILPERVRLVYQLPDDVEPYTGLAIGYLGDPDGLEEPYRQRDLAARTRRPLASFLFSGRYGEGVQL